ncbi:MAG: Lrp/AsnC ligand binding domain-containing protein, partial [Rikenellaceae bacterium]
ECHHTTGPYDLLVKIYARNNSHLHNIIQDSIQPLGLSRCESVISYKESFRRQLSIGGVYEQEQRPILAEDI